MSKSLTSEILREYEKIRDRSEKEYKMRKDEVYKKIPRIRKIEVEMAKLSIKSSKAIFDTPEDSKFILKEMEYSIKKLQQEKAFLLTEHNISMNYLELTHNCSNCLDTGFTDKGKKCGCFKQKLINFGYRMSNLSNSF